MINKQYPIGKWEAKNHYSDEEIKANIESIESYPAQYRDLTINLSDSQMQLKYREGAWNIKELVVHLADMHILHYARIKQALTEDKPNGYIANINGWNALREVQDTDINDALLLLNATHKRYAHLLKSLEPEEFNKTFHHAIRNFDFTVAQAIDMTVWHAKHHLEHIKIALASA